MADGFTADGSDFGDRLVERLSDQGLRVVRRDLTSTGGAAPAARLHVLSGGATSVNDRSTWMPRALALTRTLLQGAHREDHTLVGICLGSQMIAEALWPGGVRAGEQIEAGLTEVLWRAGASERIIVPAFHYEELDPSTLAGGGEVVADNAHSPVQGFRLGPRIWGLQFHPELEPADLRCMLIHHRQTIEAHRGSTEAALRSVDQLESRWKHDLFDRVFHRIIKVDDHSTE
ncbi:MAG: type 1 glutamine amidotransferase [Streptomycetales bacterium]